MNGHSLATWHNHPIHCSRWRAEVAFLEKGSFTSTMSRMHRLPSTVICINRQTHLSTNQVVYRANGREFLEDLWLLILILAPNSTTVPS